MPTNRTHVSHIVKLLTESITALIFDQSKKAHSELFTQTQSEFIGNFEVLTQVALIEIHRQMA